MEFYESIADYYEDIFPAGEASLNLLAGVAGQPPRTILDIACGTGAYSVALAKRGHLVTAVDLDTKMVELLKEKLVSTKLEGRVHPIVGDMLELGKLFPSKYDLAFCIGNSLVHLDGQEKIYKFFKDVRLLLADNGHLVIQIINYDRILKKNIKSLPTIEVTRKQLKFHRLYHYDNDINRILFKTILEVEGTVLENEIPLYPLLSRDMNNMLHDVGFSDIKMFGDFQNTEFQKDNSYALVAVIS